MLTHSYNIKGAQRHMTIFTVIKLILFLISNLGYWEYFRRKKHIDTAFIPIFVISLQVSVLFIAGILNCLHHATLGLYSFGFILAIYYLIKDFKHTIKSYLKIEYFALTIICILLLIAINGKIFTHYDNFSHWCLVVKNMFLSHRYPNFNDPVIMFKEYPLGSATYIYYVGTLVSQAESFQMFIQALMIICCYLPIFKYAKKYKALISIYFILFLNYLLCYNIKIYELLVDTLLGSYGILLLFFIYDNNKKNIKQKYTLLYTIPMLITAMQIKNAGILFVILGCIYIIANYKEVKLLSKIKLLTVLSPFISLFIWQRHCTYVFNEAETSTHAMTANNYINGVKAKNIYFIKDVCIKFLKFMFSGRDLHFVFLFIIALILLSLLGKKTLRKQSLKITGYMVFLYVIFMFGTLLTYIFSMSVGEAEHLMGIERYRKTIFISIYYLLMIESIIILQGIKLRIPCLSITKNTDKTSTSNSTNKTTKFNIKFIIAACSMFLVLILSWKIQAGYYTSIFDYNKDSELLRTKLEKNIKDYNVQPYSSYAVCINTNDYGYAYFLIRYILMSPNCNWFTDIQDKDLKKLNEYDYIFVLDKKDNIKKWIKKNYPKQKGNEVIITSKNNK